MKTIDLKKESANLPDVIGAACMEPVLIISDDGKEFIVSQADDFDEEVENLRNSLNFQSFLDERMKCETRFSIEDIEKEFGDEFL